jgi:uncharacterized membrane protein YidH (DUF202 family)
MRWFAKRRERMPQTRRIIYAVVGSALLVGGILVFYASAHHWLPGIAPPTQNYSARPDLALIALLGVSALAGGVSLLTQALFSAHAAMRRNARATLGGTLCLTGLFGLIYTAQGWGHDFQQAFGQDHLQVIKIEPWVALALVSAVVLVAGANMIYEAVIAPRRARRTPPSAGRSGGQSLSTEQDGRQDREREQPPREQRQRAHS